MSSLRVWQRVVGQRVPELFGDAASLILGHEVVFVDRLLEGIGTVTERNQGVLWPDRRGR